MGGDEAKPVVEAVRIGAGLVTGQLDQDAAAPSGFADRPAEHGATQACGYGQVGRLSVYQIAPQRFFDR